MNRAILMRYKYLDSCTVGILFANGQTFHTLERPWLNNARNASCIPTGIYPLTYMKRSGSGKYKNVYWLRNVPDRSGILIHNGNIVKHTLGCILIGMRPGQMLGQRAVLNSVTAKNKLAELDIDEIEIVGEPS